MGSPLVGEDTNQKRRGAMEKQTHFSRQIIGVIIFSIAMGFLETAVVVYLRQIFYPDGFKFPLIPIPSKTLIVELCREAATLIMLVWVGLLAGKTKYQRFAFFLLAFGIWDIVYYVFLKILLGWPASLATWDILFLIPVPWVGPVWAPCILALTMILFAAMILWQEQRTLKYSIPFKYVLLLIIGCIVVISSFCIDPISNLSQFSVGSAVPYQSGKFNWLLFVLGEVLLLVGGILGVYLYNNRLPRNIVGNG